MNESINGVIHATQEPLENPNPEQPQNRHHTLTSSVRVLDQFCRLCLRQRPDLVPLLSRIRDMSIPEVFHATTGLEITLEDTYPLKTCRTCMELLDYAYDIRQNFSESYRILKIFLLSKTQPLTSSLSEYQGEVRATSETFAERMLRKNGDLMSQRQTVDQRNALPTLNPGVLKSQEEQIRRLVHIKQEPELLLEQEELPDSESTIAEAITKSAEPPTETMLQECWDLRSQRTTVVQCKAEPELNLCVIFPQTQMEPIELPVEIKHEPELILEPEELPHSAKTAEEAITNDDEPLAEKFDKMRNVALPNKVDLNKCYICNNVFETTIDVQVHLLKHVDMIPFQCSACTKETGQELKITSLNRLHRHFRVHAIPNKTSKEGRFLYSHVSPIIPTYIKPYHEQSDQVEYTCKHCGKNYLNKSSLTTHVLAHKALDEGRYPCPYCDKKLPTKVALIRHKRRHTGEKPYQCDACGISFIVKENLSAHVSKFHTKSKHVNDVPTMTCKFEGCDFSTTKKHTYYHHKAKHELKFQCTQCPRRFQGKQNLQKHQYAHIKSAKKGEALSSISRREEEDEQE